MAWMNLLSVIRQLPVFGIYVIMFTDILKTFFQFAIVFVIFIIAFGLGFHILLENQVLILTTIDWTEIGSFVIYRPHLCTWEDRY